MEYQKFLNLLDTTSDNVPKFNTKKWIEVDDQSGESYNINKQIRFKTSMLRSDICDYSDAYIVIKGTITVGEASDRDKHNKSLVLKNHVLFISWISKINGTLIENAEDLDIVMPMYNLIEYRKLIQRHLVLYGIIAKIFQLILSKQEKQLMNEIQKKLNFLFH